VGACYRLDDSVHPVQSFESNVLKSPILDPPAVLPPLNFLLHAIHTASDSDWDARNFLFDEADTVDYMVNMNCWFPVPSYASDIILWNVVREELWATQLVYQHVHYYLTHHSKPQGCALLLQLVSCNVIQGPAPCL
jgi:hypothetical protein